MRVQKQKHHDRGQAIDEGRKIAARDAEIRFEQTRVERGKSTDRPQRHRYDIQAEESPRETTACAQGQEIGRRGYDQISRHQEQPAWMDPMQQQPEERAPGLQDGDGPGKGALSAWNEQGATGGGHGRTGQNPLEIRQ